MQISQTAQIALIWVVFIFCRLEGDVGEGGAPITVINVNTSLSGRFWGGSQLVHEFQG